MTKEPTKAEAEYAMEALDGTFQDATRLIVVAKHGFLKVERAVMACEIYAKEPWCGPVELRNSIFRIGRPDLSGEDEFWNRRAHEFTREGTWHRGIIEGDETWLARDNPHWVHRNIYIPAGSKLHIAAGCVVVPGVPE